MNLIALERVDNVTIVSVNIADAGHMRVKNRPWYSLYSKTLVVTNTFGRQQIRQRAEELDVKLTNRSHVAYYSGDTNLDVL